MEANMGGESQRFYGQGTPDFVFKEKDWMGVGRKSVEWDLNDWKWDGDLFVARPLNPVPLDCRGKQLFPVGTAFPPSKGMSSGTAILVGEGTSNSSCSDEIDAGIGKGKGELEKRRRVEDDVLNEGAGALTLKLGGHVYPITDADVVDWGERNGKKTKFQGSTSSRSVCQVEDCRADLSKAKSYHRRHKVCEVHSKASEALVGNVMQRFCQQCSRFHLLQEFDEGKRSCRRRLAGHNRRRRKSHPDAVGGSSLNDDHASSYLLISLLRILSNLHCNYPNSSNQAKDQDFLSHLLRNLASLAGTFDGRNLSRILQDSQKTGTSSEAEAALLSKALTCFNAQESSRPLCSASNIKQGIDIQDPLTRSINQSASVTVASMGMPQTGVLVGNLVERVPSTKLKNPLPVRENLPPKVVSTVERVRLNNIDLNDIYDSQDCMEGSERLHSLTDIGTSSFDCPSWIPHDSHQSSPPQLSGNSDLASGQSPSSSNGDAQSRTDRIVFKLFGKDPNEFPLTLRAQILDWLSHSPTDIESYIRPGCIILTIYLRLTESTWKELCCELSSSLHRLLDVSGDAFWTTGWVYARLQHRMAFIYNGQTVLDTPMLLKSLNNCCILSVTPIAVSSGRANFTVKGFNLCRSTTRLLCAFEGEYLVQDMSHISVEGTDSLKEHDELSCLSFSCSIPNVIGRGFIEVEDHELSSNFFPFIVAEQDVCSEIRMLESAIEADECNDNSQKRTDIVKAKNHALDFLHEMGWLLRRSHLKSRSDRSYSDIFPFIRFKWLMEFSMDHDWCAVVKKLLDVLFEGTVASGECSSVELALSGMNLLHRAVRRNCRPMVELLLRYTPDKTVLRHQQVSEGCDSFLFRPDVLGPAGVTPLHIAASRDDTENVLDALTDDPGLVGIEAWKNARDSTGFAPEDYARMRGNYSYIHLVQKKINKKSEAGHVVLDITGGTQKQMNNKNNGKITGFQTHKCELGAVQAIRPYCKVCDRSVLGYSNRSRSLLFRPAMLSMLAIAAVCVCVGLFFHGPPEVICVFPPFRWELLDFGSS